MFIPGACPTTFADQSLVLLPDRAIFWPDRGTLLLADVHLGKSASFRTLGLPVPEGSTIKDLSRISKLIEQTSASRLIILGDLIHAKTGRHAEVMDVIAQWRESHRDCRMTLVRGNHDRASGRIPAEWNIEEVEEPLNEDEFQFSHDLPCDGNLPTFTGHVHPTVHLTDYDGSTVPAPCFVFDARCAILPAFGTFTGGYKVEPQPGRRMFLVAASRIVPLSTPAKSGV
jgi:DNA ligase-associated metallophosphoesterase